MTPTLVIALHGTRHRGGRVFAEQLRSAVAAQLPSVPVELGWVDIEPELLAETVARLGPSVVVPTFLAAGYHVAHDVTEAVAATAGRSVATEHVGGDLLLALLERLLDAGPLGDGVVLAAIGSKRLGAQAEVHDVARRLSELIGLPVRPGFIYASAPSLDDVVAGFHAEGRMDLTVATHALAPGLYMDHIDKLGLRAVAEPIGIHPLLVDAIASRYLAATLAVAA